MRWLGGHQLALWLVFLVLHVWLAMLLWMGPLQPFNDVTVIYRGWVEDGLRAAAWVGIQLPFVYPPLALLPMVAAAAFGTTASVYGWTWLALVTLLDAGAVLVLTRTGGPRARRRGRMAAWWWLAFLLALGPVALGRLEAVTVPLAIVGVRLLLARPAIAGALLAAAAWIKIWPAAILAAGIVALRRRITILGAALVASLVIVGADLVLGGGRQLLSVLADQQGRGLQVESLLAGPWLLAAATGAPETRVVWDAGINTFEITGPGTEIAAAASTPLLVVLAALVLALGAVAARRRRSVAVLVDVLAPLAIAMVAVLVVTNKVGSPQFTAWIAAPIVLAVLVGDRGAGGRGAGGRGAGRHLGTVPALLGLVLALLTQLVYPFWYDAVLGAQLPAVLLLEAKNAIWLVLLGWGIARMARGLRVGRVGGRSRPGRSHQDAVLDGLQP